MRSTLALLLLILGTASLGHADELPEAPPTGVDADFKAALDEARVRLASGHADEAARIILMLNLEDDRFAKAQLPILRSQSREILFGAGRALAASGRRNEAAVALDAAWTLNDRTPSPELSTLLLQLADTTPDRGEKLWLARRARAANPQNPHAAQLDERLSHNALRVPALVVTLFGVGLAVTGGVLVALGRNAESQLTGSVHSRSQADDLLAQRSQYTIAGGVTLGVGAAAIVIGGALLSKGQPHWRPTSPELLPALPEGSR
jgi:hypothetical protein